MTRLQRASIWAGFGLVVAGCSVDTQPILMQSSGSTAGTAGSSWQNGGNGSAGMVSSGAGTGGAAGGVAGHAGHAGSPDTCHPKGVYAARAQVDVYWGGNATALADLTDPGRQPIVIDLKLAVDDIDSATGQVSGTTTVCNAQLPPFTSSLVCEAYHPLFPTEIWDSPNMPRLPLTGQWQCENERCDLKIDPETAMLGIELPDSEGPWPRPEQTRRLTCPSGSGRTCFPDHDGDQQPGITVIMETGGNIRGECMRPGTLFTTPYSLRAAPLSAHPLAIIDGVHRTDNLYLGLRTRLGASFSFDEHCQPGSGIGEAKYLESRAWSCRVQQGTTDPIYGEAGPNQPCANDQAEFMDANLPSYFILDAGERPPSDMEIPDDSRSPGTTFELRRVAATGNAVSCDQVRATLDSI